MKFVPNKVSRLAGRSLLKLNASSPTLLVVGGVVGLGATAVLAARATRKIEPLISAHKDAREDHATSVFASKSAEQQAMLRLYTTSATQFTRLYGPTIVLGVCSAAAILTGHKVLRGRHMATMAAYSGLMEQFQSYRGRVAKTLGPDVEKGIYDGAHGEWVEDPDHKGEYKLEPKFDPDSEEQNYIRPWFDERCPNWVPDATANRMFLTGVQNHLNNVLSIRGHVFLNDLYDALRLPRVPEGQVCGWIYESETGDGFVDLGFMTSIDPQTVAFRNEASRSVQLNCNIDRDPILYKI